MKLCFLSDASSLHIAEWAQFFAKKEWDVAIITDNPSDIDGVKIYPFPKFESNIHIPFVSAFYQIIRKVFVIRRLINTIQPDIIHSHYANIYGFLVSFSGFHPHILTCHGSDLLVHPKQSKVEKYFVKRALKYADKITLPSKEMADTAINLGSKPEKIFQIQYGVNLDKFKFSGKQLKPIRLISTRILTSRYKTELLIEAFSLIRKKYSEIHFDILGDGPEFNRLVQIVSEKNIQNYVTFWGAIEHLKIAEFYNRSLIYLTASPTDGLSISLLEAFACGSYPILPDNESNKSISDMGFNVKLYKVNSAVDLANTISDVLENISEIEPLIKKNRKLLEDHFDRNKNMARIETIYKDMIK